MKINFKTELFIPSKLNSIQKQIILEEIYHLVKHSWGEFEKDFLEEHILKSERLMVGWHDYKLIGFCAMRKKNIQTTLFMKPPLWRTHSPIYTTQLH